MKFGMKSNEMKNNKNQTFRFPFDIDTRVFLVLSVIFFILSIRQVSDYFFPKFSIHKLKAAIEKDVATKKADFTYEHYAEKLYEAIELKKNSSDIISTITKKKYGVYFFKNHELKFWNTTAQIPPKDTFVNGKFSPYIDKSGYYIVYSYPYKDANILLVFTVKKQNNLKNQYLLNHFPIYDNENDFGMELSLSPLRNSLAIELANSPIYYIYKNEEYLTIHDKNGWRLFINSLPFIFFGISIHTYFKVTIKRKKALPTFLILLSMAIVLRLLNYFVGFPNDFSNFSLFSPEIFASDSINRSLGDVFINMCLVFWILIFYIINVQGQFNDYKKFKWNPFWGTILISIFAILGIYISNLVYEIIHDSVIIFDFTLFSQLNLFSLVGLLVFLVTFANFVMLAILVNNYLDFCFKKKYWKYIVLIAVGIVFEIFYHKPYELCYYYVFLSSIIIFLMLDSNFFRVKFDFNSYSLLFWIMLISLFEAFFLFKLINNKENLLRKDYAIQLLKRDDKDVELKLTKMYPTILADTNLAKQFASKEEGYEIKINEYFFDNYITPSLQKYQSKIYLLNNSFQSIGNIDSAENNYIQNTIKHDSVSKEISQGIVVIESMNEKGYFLKAPINYHGEQFGFLLLKLYNSIDITNNEYNNFLYPDYYKNKVREYNYSIAIYENNQLKVRKGNYVFQNEIFPNDIFKGGDEIFKQEKGHSILWYRQTNSNNVVVVVRKSNPFYLTTTLFAYIFFIYFAVISLYIFGNIVARSNLNYGRFVNLLSLNLRLRIHVAILIVVLLSFLTIGYFTSYYLINRIINKSTDELQNYSQFMQTRLNEYFNQSDSVESIINPYSFHKAEVSDILTELSTRFNCDINIYGTEKGELLYTSQPELHRMGLVSNRINYTIYRNLQKENIEHFLNNEYIGNYNYLSSYSYLKNASNKVLAIMQVSYISSNIETRSETSSILITLINTYVFVFLLSSFFALVISNSVTKKFRSIVKQFTKINLSRTNQPLKWNSSDEIGLLIKEYNRMLKKLENSSVLLAKSERESAWREMAKQVAHEIKNPLTPMKLSIQMLERAIKNKNPNINEITEKVSNTLLEHIDVLTQIATNFSSFAKMPELQREYVSLNEILFAVTGMYNDDANCEYLFLIPDYQIMIYADKNQLIRVFTNIIQNAIQAIPEHRKGNISMVVTKLKDNFIRITIIDNGEGITPEKGERLFEPYFTTKSSGTGLGLAMCKDIIEKFNGRISFESQLGEGSSFHIDLPVEDANEEGS